MEEETEIDATAVSGRICVQAVSHDVTDEAEDDNQQTEVKVHEREQVQRTSGILSCIPDPPKDWKLNNLLDDIAMQTTSGQLERYKGLFRELQLEHFEKYVDIIKTLSTDLMDNERIAIQSSYESEEHKEITKHMEQSQNLFLIGIICMEYSRTTSPVDIENFITGLFKKVSRSDLAKKFEEKINEVKQVKNTRTVQMLGVEHTFLRRIGLRLYPALLNTTFSQVPQRHVAVSTQNTFDMIFRPVRSFVLRTIQTLHYFSN